MLCRSVLATPYTMIAGTTLLHVDMHHASCYMQLSVKPPTTTHATIYAYTHACAYIASKQNTPGYSIDTDMDAYIR